MNIRLAVEDDIDLLVELRRDFYAAGYPPQPEALISSLADQVRQYLAEHLGHDFFAVIAEDEGLAAGTAFLVMIDRPASPGTITGRTGEIGNVLTRPAFRGRGLATAMVEKLITIADREGASRVDLAANEAGRGVYERMGFTAIPGHTHLHYPLKPSIS